MDFSKIFFAALIASVVIPFLIWSPALAQVSVNLFGYDLGCSPAKAPKDGGCGIKEFLGLVRHLIVWLTIIVIPIGAAVIIWGGIVIMTAGGSEERIKKGRKVITTAVIGIGIALGSWLIINAIYLALTGAVAP